MAKDGRFDELLIPLYSAISTACYEATGHTIEWDVVNVSHTRKLFHRYGLDGACKIARAFYTRLDSNSKGKGWVEPKHMVRKLPELEDALADDEFYRFVMEAVAIAQEVHEEKFEDSPRMQRWFNFMMDTRHITPYSEWRDNDEPGVQ